MGKLVQFPDPSEGQSSRLMSRARVALAVCLLAASACTEGRSNRASGRTAPATARPSSSSSVKDGSGGILVRTVRVSSRADLVAKINGLGFDEVLVLWMGRPVRIEHYTTEHRHVRSFYMTRFGEVRVFQSNDQGITSGASVTIRGHEGVRNGDGASWVERDYILDINPFDRRYVRALRWVERP